MGGLLMFERTHGMDIFLELERANNAFRIYNFNTKKKKTERMLTDAKSSIKVNTQEHEALSVCIDVSNSFPRTDISCYHFIS